jgi:hypothetical protein
MKYAIDETELARLEELACAAGDADYSAHDDADDSTKYAAAACNAVPALVAEVRRLREKVEAWEWFGECRSLILWRGPEDEMMEIFNAAREAAHADCE